MAQRITQNPDVTLGQGSPNQRVTQNPDVTLAQGSPKQRVTQDVTLTMLEGFPLRERVTQVAVLFLVPTGAPLTPPSSIMEMCLP